MKLRCLHRSGIEGGRGLRAFAHACIENLWERMFNFFNIKIIILVQNPNVTKGLKWKVCILHPPSNLQIVGQSPEIIYVPRSTMCIPCSPCIEQCNIRCAFPTSYILG